MFKRILQHETGDTLVEVLFATVIIASVLAASYTLSNRATRSNQTSFEKTEVSNQMREQAELIKIIATANSTEFTTLLTRAGGPPPATPPTDCVPRKADPFYIEPATLAVQNYVHDINVTNVIDAHNDVFRVWIEGYDPGLNYVDFHIRGCWEALGGTGQQTGMVVRVPL